MNKRLRNLLVRCLKRFNSILNIMLRPAYKAYELWLWSQIYNGPKPRHVAIIPDGNRRWAANMGLPPLYGHNIGYEKLKEVLEWLWELDIKAVTIYAMSYENCIKRPKEERENLLNLLQKGISELIQDEIIDERKIRIKFFGYLDMVPAEIRKNIADVEQYSRKYNERFLNIALCYGGRQEIIKAVKRIAKDSREGKIKPDEISEKVFRKYLSTSHLEDGLEEPDLVIRTSGELRISNFLLWQIAYSELYFCDAFWPEFRKIDLWRAIRSYQKRERRFGK